MFYADADRRSSWSVGGEEGMKLCPKKIITESETLNVSNFVLQYVLGLGEVLSQPNRVAL
jgi:hypothetical protein